MAGGRGISTPALAAAAIGAAFIYLGIKGISVASGLRSFLGGKVPASPAGGPLEKVWKALPSHDMAALAGNAGAAVAAGANSVVASAATRYQGSGSRYRWAGASPSKGWDCSGFVNYILCHDLGAPIPGYRGGTFTGSSHGPTTAVWAVWTGAYTIPRNQVQAGDLCIWPAFHMGIAVSNTQMINCPGPNGTAAPVMHSIDGGGTGILVCRRLKVI